MKHIVTFFLFIAAFFVSQNAAAQAASEPGLMVLSEQKCDYTNMDELGALQDSVFTPTLNAFVDEGKLIDWGVLVHEWGDEWNWNIYYTAESHAAFVAFWAEYVDRLNQQHPGWFDRFGTLCAEHRDNIYTIRTTSSRP